VTAFADNLTRLVCTFHNLAPTQNGPLYMALALGSQLPGRGHNSFHVQNCRKVSRESDVWWAACRDPIGVVASEPPGNPDGSEVRPFPAASTHTDAINNQAMKDQEKI